MEQPKVEKRSPKGGCGVSVTEGRLLTREELAVVLKNPYLTLRIAISLILQVLLVILVNRPHQDSLGFNLAILFIAVLAMAPAASAPRWLPFWPVLMLRLL